MNSSKRTCGKTAWSWRTKHEKLREKSMANNKFHPQEWGRKKTETTTINNHFPWEKLNVLPKILLVTNYGDWLVKSKKFFEKKLQSGDLKIFWDMLLSNFQLCNIKSLVANEWANEWLIGVFFDAEMIKFPYSRVQCLFPPFFKPLRVWDTESRREVFLINWMSLY